MAGVFSRQVPRAVLANLREGTAAICLYKQRFPAPLALISSHLTYNFLHARSEFFEKLLRDSAERKTSSVGAVMRSMRMPRDHTSRDKEEFEGNAV